MPLNPRSSEVSMVTRNTSLYSHQSIMQISETFDLLNNKPGRPYNHVLFSYVVTGKKQATDTQTIQTTSIVS